MSNKRSFILGLGHQKCGTSWLHKYLCESDLFARGFKKEYHVWDRLDTPLFKDKREKLTWRTFFKSNLMRAYKMEHSEGYYFDYFDRLIGNNKLIGADITPSYSGLSARRLEYIKRNFAERDIDVKVVILTREPLSRIKSAVRFNLDRKDYTEGINVGETDFEKALLQYYKSEHCTLRTQYQNIILEAAKVFNPEDIYVGFYENMFDEDEVKRISQFLQVEPKYEFVKVRVNKTKNTVMETKSDTLIKEFYADTYAYFYQNYPVTKELW
ncbi:sulfotransferase [Alteromonas sp. ASW11-36]|uniref:Sulfotransferase n=1 Tax=Alteromonas arenosi TaxID=3055817 RepID=A0ABT7SU32_9ALTE|nr:sulfotransferase domain-containing protein [Alteromonas sp. ASW11-36]MDM7859708.1 sulfotransferase [Alteromonas sp. ASW11-36]